MKPTLTGARPSLLRQINERQVLAAVQTHGSLSRAEITRVTGISGPTVTRAVAALLEANLLEEGDFRQIGLGRPGKSLRLAASKVSVLGVVIESARCQVIASGLDGEIHQDNTYSFATPTSYDDLINTLVERLQAVTTDLGTEILGLGVTVPGLLQGVEKRTLLSPNLHQTDGRQIGKDLNDRLKIDTVIVRQADALCLAERMYGTSRDIENFAILDITDGLGLGIVLKGHLLEGNSGLAGELGHVTAELKGRRCGCGNHGCFETVATDAALVHAVSARLKRTLTIDDIVKEVQAGQLEADKEFDNAIQYLAIAVSAVLNLFNPRRLFVHGRLFDVNAEFFPRLLELAGERTLAPVFADCEIVRAHGNKQLGAIAAVLHRITTGWNSNGFMD